MPVTVCNYILKPEAGGKFMVLLRTDDPETGTAAFSDFTRDFQHRDIIRRWEKETGAALPAQEMQPAGGGWWKYEGTLLVLYGQSADFGRFDPEWIRGRLHSGMVGTETRIDVR